VVYCYGFFNLYTLQYIILVWKKLIRHNACMSVNSLPYWQWDIHFAFPKPRSQT